MSEQTSQPEQAEEQQNAEMDVCLKGLKSEPLVGRYAREVTLDGAIDVLKYLRAPHLNDGAWVFRGHAQACWGLSTELERTVPRMADWHEAEVWVLKAFMNHARRTAPAIQDLPETEDEFSWLALARHYGAPTRFLDCTRSPHVAAFFAAADNSGEVPFAIWAMKQSSILQEASRLLGCQSEAFQTDYIRIFFRETWPPVIVPVEPARRDERQRVQQALFLCPNVTHWGVDFETSLKYMLQRPVNAGEHWLCKIIVQPQARADLLTELRMMGISYETLLPGLDGLAKSLRTYVSVQSDDFDYLRREFEPAG
jgi:hypothetical protein